MRWSSAPCDVIAKVFALLLRCQDPKGGTTPCSLSEVSLSCLRDAYRFASTCKRFSKICGSKLSRLRMHVGHLHDPVALSLDLTPLIPYIRLAGESLLEFSLTGLTPDVELLGSRQILLSLAKHSRKLEVLRLSGAEETPLDGICYFNAAFKHSDIWHLLGELPASTRIVEVFRSCPPSEFRSVVKQIAQSKCPKLEYVSFDTVDEPMSSFLDSHKFPSFWAGAPSKYLVGMLGNSLRRVQLSVEGDASGVYCRTLGLLSAKCPQLSSLEVDVAQDSSMRCVRQALKSCLTGFGERKIEMLTLGNLELSPKFCKDVLGQWTKCVGLRHCSWRLGKEVSCLQGIESGSSLVAFAGGLDDLPALPKAGCSRIEQLSFVNYAHDEDITAGNATAEKAAEQLIAQNLSHVAICGSDNSTNVRAELALLLGGSRISSFGSHKATTMKSSRGRFSASGRCSPSLNAGCLLLRSLELTRVRGLEESHLEKIVSRHGYYLLYLGVTSCADLTLSERVRVAVRNCRSLSRVRLWSPSEQLSGLESRSEFVRDIRTLSENNVNLVGKLALVHAAGAVSSVSFSPRSSQKRKRMRRMGSLSDGESDG